MGTTMKHGNYGYSKHGCRCEICVKERQKVRARSKKKRRLELGGQSPPQHGVYSAYVTYECRCRRCREWNTERNKSQKDRGGNVG